MDKDPADTNPDSAGGSKVHFTVRNRQKIAVRTDVQPFHSLSTRQGSLLTANG